MWYEAFGFRIDPYTPTVNPFTRPPDVFIWNRDDLQGKRQWETFIQKVIEGGRVALKVYGSPGSGKTWLLRMTEIKLREQLEGKGLIVCIQLDEYSSTIDAIYSKFLDGILPHLEKIRIEIAQKIGFRDLSLERWLEFVPERNLAACLWNMTTDAAKRDLCQNWLEGEKLSPTDRRELKLSSNLDQEYKKVEVIKNLISISRHAFPRVVVILDELTQIRPASRARAFSSVLQSLLDSFSANFGLVCSYTATAPEELMEEWGYTEWLYRRFDYTVSMDLLSPDFIPTWLALHHTTHRKPQVEIKEQLVPFTEEGIKWLVQIMERGKRYPANILENCRTLGPLAAEENKLVDKNFILKHREKLAWVSPQATLM